MDKNIDNEVQKRVLRRFIAALSALIMLLVISTTGYRGSLTWRLFRQRAVECGWRDRQRPPLQNPCPAPGRAADAQQHVPPTNSLHLRGIGFWGGVELPLTDTSLPPNMHEHPPRRGYGAGGTCTTGGNRHPRATSDPDPAGRGSRITAGSRNAVVIWRRIAMRSPAAASFPLRFFDMPALSCYSQITSSHGVAVHHQV